MSEQRETNMIDNDVSASVIPQDKVNSLPHKGKELLKYIDQKQATEVLLLDLLRSKELSQKDYDDMLRKGQIAYQSFLKKLTEDDQKISLQ